MLQTMKTAGSPPFTPQPRQDIADRQGLARDAARDLAAVAALVAVWAMKRRVALRVEKAMVSVLSHR